VEDGRRGIGGRGHGGGIFGEGGGLSIEKKQAEGEDRRVLDRAKKLA
jgi:hypothetical protein